MKFCTGKGCRCNGVQIKDLPDYAGNDGFVAMDSSQHKTGRVPLSRLREMIGGGSADPAVLNSKADKVENATENDLATLDAEGNLTDSGIHVKDIVTDEDYVHTDNNFTDEYKAKLDGESGECELFVGDANTTYAEWKSASDAGKALVFRYVLDAGGGTTILADTMSSKVMVTNSSVTISTTIDIVVEKLYLEWRLDTEDNLQIQYIGEMLAGKALVTVPPGGDTPMCTFMYLGFLTGVDVIDILTGQVDISTLPQWQKNRIVLQGFLKMRLSAFPWAYSEGTTFYLPINVAVDEDEPSICMGTDNGILKFREVGLHEHLDEETHEDVIDIYANRCFMQLETPD
jgi:hypothetical protein